jgi:hypothetical protein
MPKGQEPSAGELSQEVVGGAVSCLTTAFSTDFSCRQTVASRIDAGRETSRRRSKRASRRRVPFVFGATRYRSSLDNRPRERERHAVALEHVQPSTVPPNARLPVGRRSE